MSGQLPGAQPRRRRGWVLPVLMAVFLIVPLVEVFILLKVGDLIGVWPTVGLLVLMAVLGSWLSKREGARAWGALNKALATGQMPQGELADAALILSGGLMLLFPGFFTDVIGLFCLLPFTRPIARKALGKLIGARVKAYRPPNPLDGFLGGTPGDPHGSAYGRPSYRQGDVIEGEVIDDDPDRKR
ncbi:FxsA family protein [Naumannella sp. ID2617S]|nr:FxsA family protein [Naumannella sp. ID2617S]